jgi:pimeloyl-ACP methyl ester carboxylesterase
VFLPGIGDLMEDYERNGFMLAAQRNGAAADMLIVDAHYGYYANRTILARLDADVVQPARRKGYEDIWLVGISMGGLGALLYASRHPGHVSGLVLLAPFLGDATTIAEITEAGGLQAWRPDTIRDEDYQRQLWRWLKETAEPARPLIHLAYGKQDRFAPGHRLLAQSLPPGRTISMPGGHDWATWNRLWHHLLARPESSFLR